MTNPQNASPDRVSAATVEKCLHLIYRSLDELNLQLPADRRVSKTPQTRLFGRHGSLDSLGLVSFVATLEALVEENCGSRVNLADEDAMSQAVSPLENVELLSLYLARRLEAA